ncbi:MAG: hypothetical protein HXX08_18775 [Chloroflexi bacterium]|uniref:Polynucleotide kinase n=1 Tax=Candidatus Chlorohelix allophototropha TaxID=3003348 RepID=A0A8T7M7C2_9CHLR|nr:hypothetical protein [Chloroflexota bacterium]WJW69807.1 hypothetical protein OZ401_003437 [Chloroflexota bacterium L227-S17]
MDKIAFIDLDGVVANSVLRFEKATKNGKINWGLVFHPPMLGLDTLIPGADAIIARLEEANWTVIYLSSRPERILEPSKKWLEKHGLDGHEIILRPAKKDGLKTPQWKASVVCRKGAPDGETLFVDDEPENTAAALELWQEKFGNNGLRVASTLSEISL